MSLYFVCTKNMVFASFVQFVHLLYMCRNLMYICCTFIALACTVFKVLHLIPDFKPVFCSESKNHAHFTQSDQVNEILPHKKINRY